MDKLDNIIALQVNYQFQRNVPEPQHGVTRRGYLTPEEAFDECEICGPIIPRFVKLTGRWLKGTCACYEQRYIERQQQLALIQLQQEQRKDNYAWLGEQWSDAALADKTFSGYQPTAPSLQDARDTAQEWSADAQGSLILHSTGFGTGKTHLLAAIVNTRRIDGKASRFTTAPKLFRAIQECMDSEPKRPYTHLIHKACTTPLLVIDDVDKAKPTEWKQEIYFEIVDERTKSGLPIALSTNRVSDLATYVGGAACSRLSIGQIAIDMNGTDYRTRL